MSKIDSSKLNKGSEDKNKSRKDFRKRGAAVLALLAVTIAGTLGQIQDVPVENLPEPIPVVQTQDMPPQIDQMIDAVMADEQEDENSTGFWAMFKRKFAKVPAALRSLIGGAPVFVIGWAIKLAAAVGLKMLTSPTGVAIAGAAVAGAAALSSVCAALKAAYPDVPLKELLTKGEAAGIFIGVFTLCLTCEFLPKYWPNMEFASEIARILLVALLALTVVFVKISKKTSKTAN